jgi:hypothetical protein
VISGVQGMTLERISAGRRASASAVRDLFIRSAVAAAAEELS